MRASTAQPYPEALWVSPLTRCMRRVPHLAGQVTSGEPMSPSGGRSSRLISSFCDAGHRNCFPSDARPLLVFVNATSSQIFSNTALPHLRKNHLTLLRSDATNKDPALVTRCRFWRLPKGQSFLLPIGFGLYLRVRSNRRLLATRSSAQRISPSATAT